MLDHFAREKTCPICQEPYSSGERNEVAVQLSCGHFFGASCLSNWLRPRTSSRKNTCPMCRQKLFKSNGRNKSPTPDMNTFDRYGASPELRILTKLLHSPLFMSSNIFLVCGPAGLVDNFDIVRTYNIGHLRGEQPRLPQNNDELALFITPGELALVSQEFLMEVVD